MHPQHTSFLAATQHYLDTLYAMHQRKASEEEIYAHRVAWWEIKYTVYREYLGIPSSTRTG